MATTSIYCQLQLKMKSINWEHGNEQTQCSMFSLINEASFEFQNKMKCSINMSFLCLPTANNSNFLLTVVCLCKLTKLLVLYHVYFLVQNFIQFIIPYCTFWAATCFIYRYINIFVIVLFSFFLDNYIIYLDSIKLSVVTRKLVLLLWDSVNVCKRSAAASSGVSELTKDRIH